MRAPVLLLFSLLLIGCACRQQTYFDSYSYLDNPSPLLSSPFEDSDYYLILLVNARHLDYENSRRFLKTIAKHPSDGTKNGDVGHAWIYLRGMDKGKEVIIEGGHSGERGLVQPRYWEGVLNYAQWGYANPSPQQRLHPRQESNPIRYLWQMQEDGFFQEGAGNHLPTFAARVNLTSAQFATIRDYIDSSNYPYHEYSLIGRQCSSFVAEVAELAGLPLEHHITLPICPTISIGWQTYQLWEDSQYAYITFSSPDRIEQSLMEAVREGKAFNALNWYKGQHPVSGAKKFANFYENARLFPSRFMRTLSIR